MDRRTFIKSTAVIAAGAAMPELAGAAALHGAETNADDNKEQKLITSAPLLENYAETSMGVAFAVSALANGYVLLSEKPDMEGAVKVKCGGMRVTDMNDKVMLVRLTGLKPATKYFYRIGADRIRYGNGYNMKVIGNEEDPRVYSFTTAGKKADAHFCVINDTHANWGAFGLVTDMIDKLAPSCVIWNGDATNVQETIESLIGIFLNPDIERKDYGSEIPYVFCAGNHDSRGMAARHFEKVWMFRQPEERKSRDWDLGRNFAIRMGDIALIGLDTAEDKLDTNPHFAGLFASEPYRVAQADWLKDALEQPEIASAPHLVAFCHIPLFDARPEENPGDVYPDDTDPRYKQDFASWQRTCAKLWGPLLEKAGCQLVVSGHQHRVRYDAPAEDRSWGQLVGGGPHYKSSETFPTVIEGYVKGGKLKIKVHNAVNGEVLHELSFKKRSL